MLCFLEKMKTVPGLLIILLISHLGFINQTYAWETNERNEYLIDIRGDDGDIYLNRLSIHKKLVSPDIEISVFGEVQWNFDTGEWEKITIGTEATKSLWKYLYIGQSLHFISGQMLDYMNVDVGNESIDTTTKIGLYLPITSRLSFRLFEEYSLNIEKGLADYAESRSEVTYRPKDSYSIGFGWRHTDRVHNLDTDYATLFLNLDF